MSSETTRQPDAQTVPYWDFKLYKILIDLMKYDHARTHDNFKLFLTVNSILIAVIGYLLRSLSKIDPQALTCYHKSVLYFTCVVSIVGMIMAIYCFLLVKRIGIDSQLRYFHLREIELKNRKQFVPGHFLMGYDFFFKGKRPESIFVYPSQLPYGIPKPPCKIFREGTRAIWAYAGVNFGFLLLYYTLFVGSCFFLKKLWLWPTPICLLFLWTLIILGWGKLKDYVKKNQE